MEDEGGAAAGRITAVRNLKADDAVLSIFTYTYDKAGNRTGVEEANGDRVTWSYDDGGQLEREQRSGANSYDITYTYDGASNRILEKDGGNLVTYSYDEANQLEWVHRASPSLTRVTYSYDANGNLALINNMGTRTTYSWDVEDRVVQVAPQGGTTNLMVYDGDGKRRAYTDSVMVRTFLWDGENIARQTERDYTYNPQGYGELISQRRSGATAFHHYDALGSTDRLTDANEAVSVSYLYKAFGEQSVLSGSYTNPFTWVGRLGYYRQADLDNYWLRARTYNQLAGRFLSRDPMPNGNLYIYPGNSPLVLVDPSGMQGCGSPGYEHGRQKRQSKPRRYGRGRYLRPRGATTASVAAQAGRRGPGGGGGGGGGANGGGGGGGGSGANGGGGGGGPWRVLIQCPEKPGLCCSARAPGFGWWVPGLGIYEPAVEDLEWSEVATCSCTKPGERCKVDFYRHQHSKKTGEERILHVHRGGKCVRPREGQKCAPSDEPPEPEPCDPGAGESLLGFCPRDVLTCFHCGRPLTRCLVACGLGYLVGPCNTCLLAVAVGCFFSTGAYGACVVGGSALCILTACAPSAAFCIYGCVGALARRGAYCLWVNWGKCPCKKKECEDFVWL